MQEFEIFTEINGTNSVLQMAYKLSQNGSFSMKEGSEVLCLEFRVDMGFLKSQSIAKLHFLLQSCTLLPLLVFQPLDIRFHLLLFYIRFHHIDFPQCQDHAV